MTPRESHFERLGLPRRYSVDAADLERRYHERSRLFHPDRHVKADGPTRVRNALATSELNQAYRTLRDPVSRAEYLLGLAGIDIADEKGHGKPVAPAFLMEIMELREALAEARAARDQKAIAALADDVRARRDEAMARVEEGFRIADASHDDRRDRLPPIAEALVALRYYHRFEEELATYEEARAEADDHGALESQSPSQRSPSQ